MLFIFPNIGLTKKIREYIKIKSLQRLFPKKNFLEKKKQYLNEIFKVLVFYENKGFFDEEKLIELKIESLQK